CFTDTFLEAFPLHRVIQVHLAGVASSHYTLPPFHPPALGRPRPTFYPWRRRDAPFSHDRDESDVSLWIDAHAAPVPQVLWRRWRRAFWSRCLRISTVRDFISM